MLGSLLGCAECLSFLSAAITMQTVLSVKHASVRLNDEHLFRQYSAQGRPEVGLAAHLFDFNWLSSYENSY